MDLRKRKAKTPYDIWSVAGVTHKLNKLHPSTKRNKKTPLPHPGQSYNPDPDDHNKLLLKVAEKELALIKKQKLIKKTFETKVDPKELKNDAEEELKAGIKHLIKGAIEEKVIGDSENSDTDDAYSSYDEKDFSAIVKDKRVLEKRKSKQQRMKQMKDKLQRKAAKLRKLKNVRLSKFDAIKKINKELDKRQKEATNKSKKHKRVKLERFGQKFEQSDPIYCLKSKLPSNLRQVSCPMDSIVREQLENFQSRLLVEPTNFQIKRRKYKKKEYDRKQAAEEECEDEES